MADVLTAPNPANVVGGTAKKESIEPEIPKELHKFVDPETKQIDYAKVAQSISEAERKISETSREKAATEAAYKELAARVGSPTGESTATGDVKKSGRKISVEDVATDPDAVIRGAASEAVASLAQPVVDDLLAIAHPEVAQVGVDEEGKAIYKDPEFVKGLQKFVGGLPVAMKQSLGDLRTAKYVIMLYKQIREGKQSTETKKNEETATKKAGLFSESARQPARTTGGGKIFKRSEIREMIARHPDEYARREAEIETAYAEDRVDLDH